MTVPSKKSGGEHVVDQQGEYRGDHHGSRRRKAHPGGGRLGVVALEYGNQATGDTKTKTLDDTLDHIVELNG